jgi:hypothetical protein
MIYNIFLDCAQLYGAVEESSAFYRIFTVSLVVKGFNFGN